MNEEKPTYAGRFTYGPDIQFDENAKVPFVVSLTPLMRIAFVGEALENLKAMMQKLAIDFENDPDLRKSLKEDPIGSTPGATEKDRVLRQVDIRNDAEKIIFKAFVGWNKKLGAWHIMLEMPSENIWETGKPNF